MILYARDYKVTIRIIMNLARDYYTSDSIEAYGGGYHSASGNRDEDSVRATR